MLETEPDSSPSGVSGRGRASYGVDAPFIPLLYGLVGLAAVAFGLFELSGKQVGGWMTQDLLHLAWQDTLLTYGSLAIGVLFLLGTVIYLHTSLRGKRRVWAKILRRMDLPSNAHVLDLGCGRGNVLCAAAKRLAPPGRAVGIDAADFRPRAEHNIAAEAVADRAEVVTGSLTALPFESRSFDAVLGSMALGDLNPPHARADAVYEALRVLRPGGTLTIVDLASARRYIRAVDPDLFSDLRVKRVGWRMWWSSPLLPSVLITAVKR